MSTLQEIEAAIDRLPREEVFSLRDWLDKRLNDDWDRQFEEDVKSGRLNDVAHKALEEHRAGLSKDFPVDEK